jgi:peptidoglycan-associated lipoprotein
MSAKRILIEGHCDERGTRDFNIQLGRRRANTTRDYILRLGIESKRICTVSKGKEEPVVSNASSEDEHQRNRRGVFRFVDSCP